MSEQPSKVRWCPICDGSLTPVESEGVVVDVCPEHGVFLDHGELAVFERRAKRGVRIGLHSSIQADMERPFKRPVRFDADGKPETNLLQDVFGFTMVSIHRPETADTAPPPKLDRSNAEVVPEGLRACPCCGRRMQVAEKKDLWGRTETIMVDTCDPHGIWLDHSELLILLDRSNQNARRNARRARRRGIEWAKERELRRNTGR